VVRRALAQENLEIDDAWQEQVERLEQENLGLLDAAVKSAERIEALEFALSGLVRHIEGDCVYADMDSHLDSAHAALAQEKQLETEALCTMSDKLKAAQARIEALERALRANMDWIGAPPADPHSYDSVREEAWALGVEALAQENQEVDDE